MPRSGLDPGRRGRSRALIVLAILALSCAEERERDPGCEDCGIHPAGILDPDSADFHGRELERRGWDFALCAGCHGEDFTGGAAGVSCVDCHQEGVTACTTCHPAEPDSGAHPAHRGAGPLTKSWECAECHQVPDRWDAEGHILRGGVADPPPAEIDFGPAAGLTPDFAERQAQPAYDPATRSCSGVYCHGDALAGGGASNTRPVWTGSGQADCGSCHGTPPDSHAAGDCATCHPPAAPHIDGSLAIGTEPGCAGCHGSSSSPAPPRDLTGNTLTSAIGVGAHSSHLDGPLRLRGPIPCATCHAVPAAIDSAGHIDSATPAEVMLAGGGDWRRSDATCRSWCHGASEPVWTLVGEGEVFCGSCHGVPPEGGSHTPDMPLTSCAGCHPATVDSFGNILVDGEASQHMDGNVDL